MPFAAPWTDVNAELIRPNTLKYYLRCRAETESSHWDMPVAVIAEGKVVGAWALNFEKLHFIWASQDWAQPWRRRLPSKTTGRRSASRTVWDIPQTDRSGKSAVEN